MKEFKQYLRKQKSNSENLNGEKFEGENRTECEEFTQNELSTLQFIPGIIVKIDLPKPCPEAKKLKVSSTHYI